MCMRCVHNCANNLRAWAVRTSLVELGPSPTLVLAVTATVTCWHGRRFFFWQSSSLPEQNYTQPCYCTTPVLKKCKYMIISRRHTPVLPSDKLQLLWQTLCKVSLYKYLGVLLSSDMKWSHHIELFVQKLSVYSGCYTEVSMDELIAKLSSNFIYLLSGHT